MLRGSQTLLLTFLTLAFTGLAAHASAKDFVLEDWDGPAPVKSWYSNPSLDTKGWAPVVSDPLTFSTWTGATWWAPRGLYATAKFALFAGPGTGEWQWQAPGSSTVYRAEYGPAITRTVGCVNEGMRTSTGAWQPTVNGAPGWTARTSAHPTACTPGAWVPWTPSGQVFIGALGRQVFCSTSGCGRTGSPTGNRAVFGVQRTRAVQPQFDAYLPGARLYLTDYDKPTIAAGTNSLSGWVNTGTGTATATATDTGLGVKSVTITGPTPLAGTAATKTTALSCTGDRNDRCPASWNPAKPNTTANLAYDVATLPEGINPFNVTATDIVDNTSAANTTAIPPVKVDRTAPGAITATGPLVDDEDDYFNGTDPQNVTVTATDPAATNGQTLSGVRIIRIEEVGAATLATKTLACNVVTDQCSAAANETVSVPLTGLSEGAHQLRAVVTDLAGNTASGSPWTVYVDRTPPAAPHSITSDFDEDESVATASWDTTDAALPDGTPGSGVREYRVRYTVGGTTHEVTTAVPTVVIEGAHVGDTVTFEVSAVDNVGNASAASQKTLAVAALPSCTSASPGTDPVPAGLLPGTPTEQADMFVFDSPVSPARLLAGLPAGVNVISMLDRSPDPLAQYTSAILTLPGETTAQALSVWRDTLDSDTAEERSELQAARGNSADPEYVAEVDRQIAQVDARRQRMASANGVPVRAFSVVHATGVAAAIETAFAGNLSRGATVLPGTDCGDQPTVSTGRAQPAQARAAASSTSAAARATHPIEVKDYTVNSYNPPYIRVRTQLDGDNDRNKITVAWKYAATSNLSYWKSKHRRPGALQGTIDLRGTEVKVLLNQDGGGEGFGLPWWYNNAFELGPAPSDQSRPTAGVWNANFRCAYPEDYFRDDRSALQITIGLACRPSSRNYRYRWAHYLTQADNNDRVEPLVNPTHYAQEDHPGGSGLDERLYCERSGGRLGSCMFRDDGPPQRLYQLQNGDNTTLTPSNVVFRRRPL